MKKSKIIKIGVGIFAAVLAFVILFFAIAFSFGYRFTAYDTVEDVWVEDEKIETDGWVFYYYTSALLDEAGYKTGEVLEGIAPVQKIGFMYRALESWNYKTVTSSESGKVIGVLAVFEGDGVYYNFFLRLNSQEEVPVNFSALTVDSENVEFFAHSYFVTESEVFAFEIDGVKVTAQ